MPLRTKRGRHDLLGLGVHLQPEQVRLLEEPATGFAITLFKAPDPSQMNCCGERHHYLTDYDVARNRVVPVHIPIVIAYDNTVSDNVLDDALEWAIAPNGLLTEESIDMLPILLGDLHVPLDVMPLHEAEVTLTEDDWCARVPWDLWPITEEQAGELDFALSSSLQRSDYADLLAIAAEFDPEDPYGEQADAEMTRLMETGDPHPHVQLPAHLESLWKRTVRSSRRGWDAIDAAIQDPLRPWAASRRPERMFSSWF